MSTTWSSSSSSSVSATRETCSRELVEHRQNSRADPTSSPRFSIRPWRFDGVPRLRARRGSRESSIAACSSVAGADVVAIDHLSRPGRAARRTRRCRDRAGPLTPASSAWRSASANDTPIVPGVLVEPGHARLADAALGHVDHALHADLVERVDHRTQVGHRVLDLTTVVEARAADHLVRHPHAHEGLLDHARLGVGAVEHGHLAPVHRVVARGVAGRCRPPTSPRHPRPRRGSGGSAHPAGVGPQRLRLAFEVVLDHGVGGIEDRLGRAVVLIEHDRGHVVERVLELQDVAEVGTAESVHALIGVADDAHVLVATREQPRTISFCAWFVSWYSSTRMCSNRAR